MNQKIGAFCASRLRKKKTEKLIDLVVKINQALEECNQKPRYHVAANAYSYSVAPQLSQAAEYDC
jgi:hypothetical protein